MDQRYIKGIFIEPDTDLTSAIRKGYRAFLVVSVDPTKVLDELIKEEENLPYYIFLKGDHDLDNLYKFIGDVIGFDRVLKKDEVKIYKGISRGIYEWPEKIHKKFVLCYPSYKGDAGGFIMVDSSALYDYEELKSSRLFDERDSDEIDLVQRNFKNSVRRGRLIGVYSRNKGFPKKGEQKKILKHGAQIIFENPNH